MAEFSAPFSSSPIATEGQWSAMAKRWGLDGVLSDQVSSSSLRVSASGAATVSVAAGEAFVNGHYYSLDSAKTLPVASNSGGSSARLDLVVLRCDPSANSVIAVYRAGGSVPPVLTQVPTGVWEIPLAQCSVAAGAVVVAAAAVADRRWFTGKPVAIGSGDTAARRPSTPGQLLVEGRNVLLGDGVTWDLVATAGQLGDWKTLDLFGGSFGYTAQTTTPQYRVINGAVQLRGNFRQKAPTHSLAAGEITQFATMPAEARPGAYRYTLAATEWMSDIYGRIEIRPDGSCWYLLPSGTPANWCSLDSINYSL